jgi:hypothetical protein
LLAVSAGTAGTATVEAGKEQPAWGVQKPRSWGWEKMVPMRLLDSSCYEGVETRGLDYETHLCVERLPQRAVAALDTMLALGGQPRTAWCGIHAHAWPQRADGDDLVPGPDSDGEGAGATVQDSVGAVVGLLHGRDDAAAADPDKGGTEEVPRELLWQLAARVVLARQRKNRSI